MVTRFQQFGNPIVHIDEQFYLLVGDRMLSGALPYVDLWDRKPIGLFLIYSGIRLLGGAGILQYQIVATGFAVGTALIVERIAAQITGPRGAWAAAILYLLWIPLLTGQGGQSPVFYNLFVAAAALAIVKIGDRPIAPTRVASHGLVAMLLVGIAMQIKYSALLEGIYFGITLLSLGWRAGMRMPILIGAALVWIAVALLPTFAAAICYWWMGHLDAFWYANFVSIFQRGNLDPGDSVRNALTLSLYTLPLVVIAANGAKHMIRDTAKSFVLWFLPGWFIAAIFSIILFGCYFDHYGLPMIAPAVACASVFLNDRRRQTWSTATMAGALIACLIVPTLNQRRRGTPAQFATLANAIRPYAAHGLLVWDNLPALYYTLKAPLLTRYPFPTHLRDNYEIGAVGIDQVAETQRILDLGPAVIVVEKSKPGAILGETTIVLMRRIAADYHLTAQIKVGRRDQDVFLLNGLQRP